MFEWAEKVTNMRFLCVPDGMHADLLFASCTVVIVSSRVAATQSLLQYATKGSDGICVSCIHHQVPEQLCCA